MKPQETHAPTAPEGLLPKEEEIRRGNTAYRVTRAFCGGQDAGALFARLILSCTQPPKGGAGQ